MSALISYDESNKEKNDLLLQAVNTDDINLAIQIINQGADVNAAGINHYTILMQAVSARNIAIIKLLLDHGANVNDWTLIRYIDEIELPFINYGSTPYYSKFQSVLDIAREESTTEICDILIKSGAKTHAQLMRGYELEDKQKQWNDQKEGRWFSYGCCAVWMIGLLLAVLFKLLS